MILKKELVLDDFFRYYYLVLNSVLNLTNTELNIIAEIAKIKYNLGDTLSEESKDKYIMSSTSRQIICDNLGMSKYNLNNYIKTLKVKGILVEKQGNLTLSSSLNINPKEEVSVTFKLKIK